ncbi:hypothetical protein L3X38_005478 [Prunus dulcis]|uniref:Retrotransposon gag domain-containing protein n=1 Tax=Prunus dulcis TaxID=3755 RepID=A0AAD4ZR16_PRUDU|nr:hypothetical protein L3X38_005478 [Prunus dulcis]
MSVAGYFTKMKGLWDELASYNDLSTCSCGAMKKQHEKEERNALMQFLMVLNESYSAERGQISLMNPLASLRRAHALVSQEKKQIESGSGRVVAESAAMVVRSNQQQQRANNNQRPNISQQHQLGLAMRRVLSDSCRVGIINVSRMLNPNPTHLINVSCRVRVVFYRAGFESCNGFINNNMHVTKLIIEKNFK